MGTARRRFGWTAAGALLIAACSSSPAADPSASSTTLSATATTVALFGEGAYLLEVLDVVSTKAYYRDRIDVGAWRERIVQRDAGGRIQQYEVEQLVGALLQDLGDGHSSRYSRGAVDALMGTMNGETLSTPVPSGSVDASGIGTLVLTGVSALEGSGAYDVFVGAAQTVLATPACGWILDLRDNTCGSVQPMLAAVAPLLGPGTFLGYLDRDGEIIGFRTTASAAAAVQDASMSTEEADSATAAPVAVLTGPLTASSGEGTTVAFIGRPGTRSFGASTRGLPTMDTPFILSDGSALNLTTAISVDRLGATHEGPITPDVVVAPDQAMAAATTWLAQQPACQAAHP